MDRRFTRFLCCVGTIVSMHATDAAAEEFIMPVSGRVYVKLVRSDSGATTDFGLGSSPADFKALLRGLPGAHPGEVPAGYFPEGARVPFAMHSTFGQSAWAFVSGTDAASRCAFSDADGSLGRTGGVIQQTSSTTWLLHLDDAMSFAFDDDDNDLVIQVRIEVDKDSSS